MGPKTTAAGGMRFRALLMQIAPTVKSNYHFRLVNEKKAAKDVRHSCILLRRYSVLTTLVLVAFELHEFVVVNTYSMK